MMAIKNRGKAGMTAELKGNGDRKEAERRGVSGSRLSLRSDLRKSLTSKCGKKKNVKGAYVERNKKRGSTAEETCCDRRTPRRGRGTHV